MLKTETILWFFITLLLMAFFAGIEMAFLSANRLRIELKKNQGSRSSRMLSEFLQTPLKFLGTTLIGFTVFLVLFSINIKDITAPLRVLTGENEGIVPYLIEIPLATFVVLIFAEFIPRALFRAHSTKTLNVFVHIVDLFHQLFYPIAAGLISLSQWILRYVFNVRVDEKKEAFTRADLENLFQQEKGSDQEDEATNTELFRKAQELPKVKIRQCLIPRKEIIAVEKNTPLAEIRKKFIETKLSKLVVFDNNIDHLAGYVHQLDMFKNPNSIHDILMPIPAVPESMAATDLISKFTRERKSIAWVVDEFGGTAGIVTMEDILEEVFGEIHDEYDTEELEEKKLSENEFIFSGRLELDYLAKKYALDFPENEDDSETLSGYIINYHEKIPRLKERIIIDDYEFEVLNVTDTRIDSVRIKKLK